mmetsp:Transcript_45653/g.138721  ORF Transcript_45653/g.138721 Transcript_45653/m.138721 type:complete len:581 (-) Transcript_45653:56-1798(-)
MPRNGTPKASYAFADTFAHPTDTGNKEYYLASAFTHVNLQARGDLNLMGIAIATPFLRSAFDKYGIKAHVFKHGKYKNAPNSLTESGFTKEHMNNTMSMIKSINDHNYTEIVRSRSLPATFDEQMWKAINNYGTLTAQNAQEIGLVDSSPRVNPLRALLKANKGEKELAEVKMKWGNEIDFDKFHANEPISLEAYSRLLSRQKKAKKRKWKIHGMMKHLSGKSTATRMILSSLGYEHPFYNITKEEFSQDHKRATTKEKIAVVQVSGGIDHKVAQSVTSCLRKLKEDKNTKCVILRVDSPGGSAIASETILEEIKDIEKPVIFSMSNAAASGGYYIATSGAKIFALPSTITGSIGVYGIKFDVTDLASQYGVKVQNISTGPLASCNNQFQPLTKKMEENFNRNIDGVYKYFKEIVSFGRHLTLEEVEAIAQGRVWTGEQALQLGLVDYLGGLDRAVSFAKLNYTGGEAEVELWPKAPNFYSFIGSLIGGRKEDAIAYLNYVWNEVVSHDQKSNEMTLCNIGDIVAAPGYGSFPWLLLKNTHHTQMNGVMLTANEADALSLGLHEISLQNNCSFPLGYRFE